MREISLRTTLIVMEREKRKKGKVNVARNGKEEIDSQNGRSGVGMERESWREMRKIYVRFKKHKCRLHRST